MTHTSDLTLLSLMYRPHILVIFLSCLVGFLNLEQAWGAKKYSFSGKVSTRIADHTREPGYLSSEKTSLQFEQLANFSKKFKGVIGFSAWYEPIYKQYPDRYNEDVKKFDSSDIRLRNAYLQYQSGFFFAQVGSQQVVWGEAFGQFYSDIVNPKDYRDGFFGDLADSRLQTPMVNTKLIFSNITLQGIFIPKPYFSILPMPTGEFALPFKKLLPTITEVEIRRQTDLPINSKNYEYGGRINGIFDGYDVSLLFLNYFDRVPYYTINNESMPPSKIILEEQHDRVQSYGLTLTKDFGGYVLRTEALTTQYRKLPTLVDSTLSYESVKNDIYVIGLDLPTTYDTNIGFQWSQDFISPKIDGLLRSNPQSMASTRIQRSFFGSHDLEIIYATSIADYGQRLQLNYSVPLSNALESKFGLDWIQGGLSSDFGKLQDASRAYMLFSYFFR